MIRLLNLNDYCYNLPKVTESKFFQGNDVERFHPNGLFSEVIFGVRNSKEWKKNEAAIDLRTKVIHPVIFRLLKRIDNNLYNILSLNKTFDIQEDGSVVEGGQLSGIKDFIDNYDRIKFRGGTKVRDKLVNFLKDKNNINKFFISYILVIPPSMRPIYKAENQFDLMYDEINDYYVKIINKTNSYNVDSDDSILRNSYDITLQLLVNEFYEYIKVKVGKKSGYLRGNLLSKRVDFSGRSVIVGNPNLRPDEVGIPFQMVVNLFRPFIIHELKNTKPDFWDEKLYHVYGERYNIDVLNLILDDISKGYEIKDKRMYDLIYKTCEKIVSKRYVLIKRDPSLHRESWQGMRCKIVEGYSIELNASSVGKFNADFDGDQMAIYHPLSKESQDEIREKMITPNGSSGYTDFNKELSKDFILGLYVLTKD